MNSQTSAGHFIAANGMEVPAVTSEQMRELDRIATEETGPTLLQMMENAGRNLALLAMNLMGLHWNGANVAVLAGSGGNGGGGICAGRHLANHGVSVNLCLGSPDRMSESASLQRRIFQHADGNEIKPNELPHLKSDLIIDALIGYGLNERPRGTTRELIAWANQGNIPILSLDVPSGIAATTGRAPGEFIRPTWTLTLAPRNRVSTSKTQVKFSSPTSEFRPLPFGASDQTTFRPLANNPGPLCGGLRTRTLRARETSNRFGNLEKQWEQLVRLRSWRGASPRSAASASSGAARRTPGQP